MHPPNRPPSLPAAHRVPRLALAALLVVGLVTLPSYAGDRFLWRYPLDSWGVTEHPPAVAPDGTLYVDDLFGALHAIAPDGTGLWTYSLNDPGEQGSAAEGPIAVAGDGTIYAVGTELGGRARLHAVGSDGNRDWIFQTEGTQGFIAGPGIGPDGNLYAVVDVSASQEAIGAFSLTPVGSLRWSDRGTPEYIVGSLFGQEILFDDGGFWVAFNGDNGAPPALRKLGYDDGDLLVYIGDGCQSVPSQAPDGTILVALGACGVSAYNPSGELDWMAPTPAGTSTMLLPTPGPDGAVFTAYNLDGFWALEPDGSTRWLNDDSALGVVENLGVTPDNSTLISGGGPIGQSGWVRGYDPLTGDLQWQEELPQGEGNLRTSSSPSFSADGRTAYLTVRDSGSDTVSWLYAFDVSGPSPACGDLQRLQVRCRAGRLQARVTLFDGSFDGETVTFRIDGADRSAPVVDRRAQVSLPGAAGDHTVELVEPAGCFAPRAVTCD
jgi:hypothetical protein